MGVIRKGHIQEIQEAREPGMFKVFGSSSAWLENGWGEGQGWGC